VRPGGKHPSSSPSTRVVRPIRDELFRPTGVNSCRGVGPHDPDRSSPSAIVSGVEPSPCGRSYRQECPIPVKPAVVRLFATTVAVRT
jgi:hypothetical protein